MDTQITIWEMSLDAGQSQETREEIASWPSEPYTLDTNIINWN
jgi:hypothetical protein